MTKSVREQLVSTDATYLLRHDSDEEEEEEEEAVVSGIFTIHVVSESHVFRGSTGGSQRKGGAT